MERDSKLGYGFLLLGVSVPYLIERIFGPQSALVVIVICAVFGVCFLWTGHNHRLSGQPAISLKRKIYTAVLTCAIICTILEAGWHTYRSHHTSTQPTAVAPVESQPTINQTATGSNCANQVAQSGAEIKCEVENASHEKNKTNH